MVEPKQRQLLNAVGMTMIWVPPGEFRMGSVQGEAYRDGDERQHRVRITRPFYLSACEVTVGQFRRFVAETGYRTDAEGRRWCEHLVDPKTGKIVMQWDLSWRRPGFSQSDDHPVVHISWNDATAFCRWLSAKENAEYHLPTEAEWEYACRAGTNTRFHTGDGDTSWFSAANAVRLVPNENGGYGIEPRPHPFTAPAGSLAPNAFGLHDMHGNAWEWCADWYDADYYRRSSVDDPEGPSTGQERVQRGGTYNLVGRIARSANRYKQDPSSADSTTGFRPAMTWRDRG